MKKDDAPVLVSACLAGYACRYDGRARTCPELQRLVQIGRAIPFCPETSGGLPTPRPPAEIQDGTGIDVLANKGRVTDAAGRDVTAAYIRGAELGLELAERLGVRRAVLKDKSPACGVNMIYDGSFGRTLRRGQGVMAAALAAAGIEIESAD